MLSILRTDAGLVAQVMAGKSSLFDELVRRHFSMVYGIAFSYTHHHADAEDLCQEAFLKAYRSLDTLQEPKKFRHWISRITRNLARNWYARRQREVEVLEEAVAASTEKSEAVYDDMREVLEQQIHALDPIPREVLMLHYFSGKSTAEIAKGMGVSQAAVLKRLQRAREVLGVKLIHDLKLIPPAENNSAQHRRIIMSAITASGMTWTLNGSHWANVVASTLLSGKAIVAGVVVTGVVTASVMLNPQPTSPGDGPTPSASLSVASATMEQGMTDSAAPAPETGVSEEVMATSVSTITETPLVLAQATGEDVVSVAEEELSSDDDPELLKGDWRAYTSVSSEDVPQPLGIAQFIRDGSTLLVKGSEALSSIVLKGEIHGASVFLDTWTDISKNPLGRLEGEFTDAFHLLTVSGQLNLENGDEIEIRQINLRFEKLTDEEMSAEEALNIAKDRLAKIRYAIDLYADVHKASPGALVDLYPAFVSDLTVVTSTDEETLTYYPALNTPTSSDQTEELKTNPKELESWKQFMATGDSGFLLAWEDELEALWGKDFPGDHVLLRLVNSTHQFTLTVSDGGSVRTESSAHLGDATARQEAKRASCANNLKQVGLVFKMFQNECRGEHIPGGFRQTYPEYLADPLVLTCPGGISGVLSYQNLYPASDETFWKDVYAAVHGNSPDETPAEYMSKVPWIIEIDACSGSDGRNVLFADGHVEFISDVDWGERMGPYLGYAYE